MTWPQAQPWQALGASRLLAQLAVPTQLVRLAKARPALQGQSLFQKKLPPVPSLRFEPRACWSLLLPGVRSGLSRPPRLQEPRPLEHLHPAEAQPPSMVRWMRSEKREPQQPLGHSLSFQQVPQPQAAQPSTEQAESTEQEPPSELGACPWVAPSSPSQVSSSPQPHPRSDRSQTAQNPGSNRKRSRVHGA